MRQRFNRQCVASSRGAYVFHAHQRAIEEHHNALRVFHEENKENIAKILANIPKKYFVKCFGKLIQITEMEAEMLKRSQLVITYQ